MSKTEGLLAVAVATERRTELQADSRREVARERAARKRGPRDPYAMEGAALAREIRAAMREVPAARRASESEQDALAQMVAERIYRRRRHGRPADVLRWIERAERCPVTAERAERVRVERGSVGRRYLVGIVASLCAQSREWLDTTERYRTRAQAQSDSGPMVDASADPQSDDLLTREALTRHDPERAPIPEDSRELCEAMARVIGTTKAEARRVAVALLADLASVPLSALAAEQGRTLNALALDRSRGVALMRAWHPSALLELAGELAEALNLRAEPNPYRPRLTRHQDAARRAIESLRPVSLYRAPGKREPADRKPEPAPCHGRPAPILAYLTRQLATVD